MPREAPSILSEEDYDIEVRASRLEAQHETRMRIAEMRRKDRELVYKRVQKQEEAHNRAKDLLFSLLTLEQARSADENKHFDIISSKGNKYRITIGAAHQNVYRLDETGQAIESLCGYLQGTPLHDTHVMQMLYLQADEDGYRKKANIFPLVDYNDEEGGWEDDMSARAFIAQRHVPPTLIPYQY